MGKGLLFFVILTLVGCAHRSFRMENLNIPLIEIQKAVVKSLPLGQRAVSSNGREFFSEYFAFVEKKIRLANHLKVRYYAHIYILGDRRPYSVEGLIRKEVRKKGAIGPEYSDKGIDNRLSKVLMRKIKKNLSKRREDHNVIDDFRVF